jgi:cell fate regulator YaaT (PSP1 superfamily)
MDENYENHIENNNIDEQTLKNNEEIIKNNKIYKAKVIHSSATEYCYSDENVKIEKNFNIIIPTKYGKDLGKVLGIVKNLQEIGSNEIVRIDRIAEEEDVKQYKEYKKKDKDAFEICRKKIKEHNLEMKLVSAHHLLGESKLLFFFTAESRVDFRELVKDLVSIFRTRIELRQIGVRDESRVIDGVGVCGRGYCCHNLTDKLNTVSIKMAKKQNLSLNSLKISGPCGRLLCCLSYEYPIYSETKNKLPQEGTLISFEGENAKIEEINVLKEKVKLNCTSGRVVEVSINNIQYNESNSRWIVKN